ncbi:AAA family ATPase [Candidatus Enterococcus courvalinii]|uniref:AAA family ATPase n=1 Tax=Candidatus Enterococcus courvalinii TaxID=2815329 RepID=A0ABS3HZA6_9ENTE|nr:AAA family ATPase [Enterococcus sp. MSG2901]MBO0481257.1 AAA family ATPase [Enterococcus sp. MSG2901]
MEYYFKQYVDLQKIGIQFIYDNWDDFGYKTLYSAYYISENEKQIELGSVSISTITEAEVCFKNKQSSNWVSYRSFDYLIEGIDVDNIISLGSVEYYEKLYDTFSDTEVKTILKELGDIAYNLKLFEENKHLDVIHTSFLRGSTVNNLKQQLNRVAKKGVKQIPFNFKLKYTIDNSIDTELTFKVNPESPLPTNVYGIIGNNGTGKTTLIQDIVKCYLRDASVKSYLVNQSEATLEIYDDYNNGGFESVLFVSFSAFDMLNTKYFSKLEVNDENSKLSQKNFKYIGNSTFVNERQTMKNPEELAKDLIENIKEIKKSPDRIKLWEEEVVKLYFDNEISNFISKNLNEGEGNVNEVAKLSSGQKMILLGLSALVSKIDEKTLIIIDEPESYLHPPLVSAYIRILSDILSKKNGVAIIATHSPVILQEIPKKCVWVLERDSDKKLTVRNPKIETFGENISMIMDDVFGLDIRNTGFYQYLSQLSEQKEEARKLLISSELGSEAELFLRIFLDDEE